MRTISSALALALVACAVTDGAPVTPTAAPPPTVAGTAATPAFTATEPAPAGSVLRVFVEPEQLVGWIAGSKSFAGSSAQIRLGDREYVAAIGSDNTFTFPTHVEEATEAVVRVGGLTQRVTVAPRIALEPTAYFVVDRGAYRPGQQLAFSAFLRRLDGDGEFRPLANAKVEVRIVSETKQSTAAKLALVADAGGRVSGEYTFSAGDPLDVYRVSIPGYRGSARVTLGEFRKSKVKLEVDAAIAERSADLRFHALDFLDQPVPGGSVSFTAQIVRDSEDAEPGLATSAFAFGSSPNGLRRDELLLYKADPETAGRLWTAGRQVVAEVKGTVELDAKGAGSHRVPIQSDFVRGHHRLLVDAVIVDANGREQRTTRSIPLARADVRVQIATPHELVAAGKPVEVSVRVVDADGRPVVAASASVAAIHVAPPQTAITLGGYYGNHWNGGWNGGPNGGWNAGDNVVWNANVAPNGGFRVRGYGACRYTSRGCRPWQRTRPAITAAPAETLAATAAVIGDRASLSIGDPGAYRLVASARLADGTVVWSEVGVAVRERETMPPLVLELDRDTVAQGERITGSLYGRYRDAAVIVLVRDANGIKSRHRVVLAGGHARLDLPASAKLGYGAAVEAFVLGNDLEVHAAQELIRVTPAKRMLSIRTDAKASYGPGDLVDLDIAVDRDEPIDLVVSVYDQSLLGVAPDHAVDPASFFLADDRLRTRAALTSLRGELGDLTIGSVIARARTIAKLGRARVVASLDANADPEVELDHAEANQLVTLFDQGTAVTTHSVVALLRYTGVQVSASAGYQSWSVPIADRKALLARRVIDFLETDMKPLAFERVADAIVIVDPTQAVLPPASGVSFSGGASGNASYSAGGNMSFSVPAGPTPMNITDGATAVVRRDFSDSAFWSANTRTGADGKARVSFRLPDSLTNWQVVVTAVSRDMHVGRHTARLRTIRDVMVWPMLPRQFTEGDTVSIFGSVHNLTDADRDIVVSLKAERADILSPAQVTVRVPRGTNVPVTWSVRAREPGLASLLMIATGTGTSDASLKRIPIVASSADQIVTASGFAERAVTVELPAGVDPRSASLELSFAPSLAADMVQTLDYLVEYPYGCAEQTMSRFAPAIRVAGILGHLGIRDGALSARLPKVVESGMKRLADMQQPDGGWGWNGHSETHEMITPYVVWGLLEADKAGHKLPDPGALARGFARVATLIQARGPETNLSDRTYLMYVYSQRNRLPDGWWNSLVERREKLSDYALALALEMAIARHDTANADRMAAALRTRGQRGNGWTHWRTGSFSRWMEDPIETSAVVLKALVAYDINDPLIPEVISYFVANKHGDRWNSTKDTAMVLYAMTEYLAKRGVKAGARDASVAYAVNGGSSAQLGFSDGLVRKVVLDGSRVARKNVITFGKASPGMMVRVVLRYRKSGRDLEPASHGLDVTRELYLLGAKGARIRPLATGDRVPRGAYVESVVTVTHGQHEAMRYLLVEDPKPAGAESLPVDDPRFPRVAHSYVLREDRETHIAFHHEEAPATTSVRTILHLEMAGELAIAPAQAELMYQTQTRGNSGSIVLRVD